MKDQLFLQCKIKYSLKMAPIRLYIPTERKVQKGGYLIQNDKEAGKVILSTDRDYCLN